MDAHLLDLFLVLCTDVQKDVLQSGRLLLSSGAGVDGRPPKKTRNHALLGVDVDPLGRGNLMVASSVAAQVNETVVRDVMHEVADFVCMRLNHHLVRCIGVDDPYDCSVGVHKVGVDVGLEVLEPQLLTFCFKARGRGIVQVFLQELLRLRRDDVLLFCHGPKLPRGSPAQCSAPPTVVHRRWAIC